MAIGTISDTGRASSTQTEQSSSSNLPKKIKSTAEAVNALFSPVMEEGEKIKVFVGQRVVLNESTLGKPREQLSEEIFSQIRDAVLSSDQDRVQVPLTEKGNEKSPEFLVVAVTNKTAEAAATSRTLFRQEKAREKAEGEQGFPISTNLLMDQLSQNMNAADKGEKEKSSEEKTDNHQPQSENAVEYINTEQAEAPRVADSEAAEVYPTTAAESEVRSTNEDSVAASQPDHVETTTTIVEPENEPPQEPLTSSQADIPEEQSTGQAETDSDSPTNEARSQTNGDIDFPLTEPAYNELETAATPGAEPTPQGEADQEGPPTAVSMEEFFGVTSSQPQEENVSKQESQTPTKTRNTVRPDRLTNTLNTLRSKINELPESPTKEMLINITDEVESISAEPQPKPNYLKQAKKAAQSFRQNVVEGSPSEIGSAALNGASWLVEASSKGLSNAGRYLKDRAKKVEEYGMATSALAIFKKGMSRTGEQSFTLDNGYTVEKVEGTYGVLDSQKRLVMSFNVKRGRPINVQQTTAAQIEDKWRINRAARANVIKGSPAAETKYENSIRRIASTVKQGIVDGEVIEGRHFHVSRQADSTTITTQSLPKRQAVIMDTGEVESNLKARDVNQLAKSVTLAIDQMNEGKYQESGDIAPENAKEEMVV